MNVLNSVGVEGLFTSYAQKQQYSENLASNSLTSGMDLYQKKDYKAAARAFRGAIALAPASSFTEDCAKYLAMAEIKLGHLDKAIEAYQTSIQLNPDSDQPHVDLAKLYFTQERYAEAEEQYAKAVAINPDAANYYSMGQAQLFQEKFGEAEVSFNKVRSLAPDDPNSYYGMGLVYSKQGRYEKAIEYFDEATKSNRDFYDAYVEMGYAYADLGMMEEAEKILEILKDDASELEDSLSRYMYKVDPPKIVYASSSSTFSYMMPRMTKVSDLDAYLQNANASKKFTMLFQFDKKMDRESVENRFNWKISRATGANPGEAYNFGFTVAPTEISITSFPDNVYWDEDAMTAKVQFSIRQNDAADGTIDPSHIEFKFSGEDQYGLSMDADQDQYTGFSKVF